MEHITATPASESPASAAGDQERAGHPSISQSLKEYGRGIVGGLLFSLPLLYTMEVWWHGMSAEPWQLMLFLLAIFGVLLGYNSICGLHPDNRLAEVVVESIEELGLALVLSAAILWLLGRIDPAMPPNEIIGKIVVEAILMAVGISVGTQQLGGEAPVEGQRPPKGESTLGEHMIMALCGALLIALNVAPTEEVTILAIELPPPQLILVVLGSLALSGAILFAIDFKGVPKRDSIETVEVSHSVIITYATALLASAASLWFFGQFGGKHPEVMLSQTVILSVPASLGASVGRLLLR